MYITRPHHVLRSILIVLVGFLLASIISGRNTVYAGCGWFCGGQWKVLIAVPATIKTPLKTSTGANKGCDYLGETSPNTTCQTSAGTTSVVYWEVSGCIGDLEEAGISIGANAGESTTYNYSANSGTTISGFCQTCQAVAGLRYTLTEFLLDCTCGSTATQGGSVKKFEGEYTEATNSLSPNPPCDPICPVGG